MKSLFKMTNNILLNKCNFSKKCFSFNVTNSYGAVNNKPEVLSKTMYFVVYVTQRHFHSIEMFDSTSFENFNEAATKARLFKT